MDVDAVSAGVDDAVLCGSEVTTSLIVANIIPAIIHSTSINITHVSIGVRANVRVTA